MRLSFLRFSRATAKAHHGVAFQRQQEALLYSERTCQYVRSSAWKPKGVSVRLYAPAGGGSVGECTHCGRRAAEQQPWQLGQSGILSPLQHLVVSGVMAPHGLQGCQPQQQQHTPERAMPQANRWPACASRLAVMKAPARHGPDQRHDRWAHSFGSGSIRCCLRSNLQLGLVHRPCGPAPLQRTIAVPCHRDSRGVADAAPLQLIHCRLCTSSQLLHICVIGLLIALSLVDGNGARFAEATCGARFTEATCGARFAEATCGARFTEATCGARFAEANLWASSSVTRIAGGSLDGAAVRCTQPQDLSTTVCNLRNLQIKHIKAATRRLTTMGNPGPSSTAYLRARNSSGELEPMPAGAVVGGRAGG